MFFFFVFFCRNKKYNVYPCKPQFYHIKVGFKGGGGGGQNYIGVFSWCLRASLLLSFMYLKSIGWETNSVNPDQTPHFICPNTRGRNGRPRGFKTCRVVKSGSLLYVYMYIHVGVETAGCVVYSGPFAKCTYAYSICSLHMCKYMSPTWDNVSSYMCA